jgi:lysophospholipase L1-like esterase
MPSKLDIAVSSVPDGTYKTILTNPADDSIVFAADVDYVSGIATTGSITPDVGTALTGFVIDNQVTPLNGSVIYGVTNVLAGVSTRYFNTLDPIQRSRYTIANPIAFAGDFEIEVEFVTSKTGVEQHLLDSSADILCKMTLSATGLAKFLVGDGSIWAANIAGTTNLSDGRLHTVKCSKVGNFYNIIVDGNQEATRTSATPVTPSITQVGRRANGTNYFDGIIANVKFTDLTNATTTTFALDTPEGDIEYSEENVFGGELWSDPATSIGNAWVYDGGGVYSRSSPTVGSDISISATTVAQGTPILITVTIDVFTSSGLVVRYQGGDNVSIPNSVGTHSVVAIAGAVGTTRVRGDSSFEGTISNISVKEISNAVQYIGIPDINEATPAREEFTLVDGDWLGSELSEVSLYNVTAGLSQIIDNTTLRILTDSGGAFTAVTAFGFSDANSYILTFTATNSGGALNITDGNGVVTYFSSTASGDFEVVIPPNGLRFKRGFGGVLNDILVTNISIKRILEVAEQPVQTATLEINDSVIFVGDSMTYAGNGAPHAYWQWLQQAQNGALYVPIDGNQGISGETTAEIAARVQSYPSTPSTVIILMGENDANGVSLASMQANFESIFTKFSTSKIVYVMPQAFTQSISGSPFKQGRRDDLNLWLSTISNTYPNVNYISNAWDGITIYDGGVGADSYDGVHMNPSGAAKLGGNVATHISSDLASGTAYDAPLYDGNNLITTTSLSGVGGSKSNSSGDVADGWALTNGSGATVVASKGTQDGSSQIIEITGTASSGSAIRLRDSIGALNIPIGDVVEGFANIKITATDGSSAPVGIEGFGYELAYNKVTWLSQYYSGAQGSFDLSGATSGVIRAYPKEIDANISTLTVDFALQPTVGAVDIRIEVSKPTAYFGLT